MTVRCRASSAIFQSPFRRFSSTTRSPPDSELRSSTTILRNTIQPPHSTRRNPNTTHKTAEGTKGNSHKHRTEPRAATSAPSGRRRRGPRAPCPCSCRPSTRTCYTRTRVGTGSRHRQSQRGQGDRLSGAGGNGVQAVLQMRDTTAATISFRAQPDRIPAEERTLHVPAASARASGG